MKKNKFSVYDIQNQRRLSAYERAQLMAEGFPELASLVINMTFKAPDWGSNPTPKSKDLRPHDKAFFEFKCPYLECVNGGFDLSDAIRELIAKKQSRVTGSIICEGWQDEERINKYTCLLEMSYDITAAYA